MRHITAIIQARLGSTRLPGKTLMMLKGKPLLGHLIQRIRRSAYVTDIIVATTVCDRDDAIANYAGENNLKVYRGSEDDVLDRFYQAAVQYQVENVVRVTPDCPMHDTAVIDTVISAFLGGQYDYASNTIKPTFPDGLDVEIFSFEALRSAWGDAVLHSEREHVTPYICKNPHLFKLLNVENGGGDLSHMRWTVDTPSDLAFIRTVYEYFPTTCFSMEAVLNLLREHPEIEALNAGSVRNEGYRKSLQEDKETPLL